VYGLNTAIDAIAVRLTSTSAIIVASHAAAVEFVNRAMRVPARRRFKTVVTSSAGYLLDKIYYQTIKVDGDADR
jgi:lactate racemase